MKKLLVIVSIAVLAVGCVGHREDGTVDNQRINLTNSPFYRYYDEELDVYCWGNTVAISCLPAASLKIHNAG